MSLWFVTEWEEARVWLWSYCNLILCPGTRLPGSLGLSVSPWGWQSSSGCTDYLNQKGLHGMAQAHEARGALDSSDTHCSPGGNPFSFPKCRIQILNLDTWQELSGKGRAMAVMWPVHAFHHWKYLNCSETQIPPKESQTDIVSYQDGN